MEYEEFEDLVAPRVRTRTQADRIKSIWLDANESIGCEAGEVLQFGARLMVEDLQNIRGSIKAVDEQIANISREFSRIPLFIDHTRLWSRCFVKDAWSHWKSLQV